MAVRLLLLLGATVLPATAHAGIFARLDLGGGVAQTSSTGLDTRVTGPAGSGELALGYEVLEGVFAAAALFGDLAFNPTRRTGDFESSDVDLALFGAGVTGQVVSSSGWFWGGGLYFARQRAQSRANASLDAVARADTDGSLSAPLDDSGFGGGLALKGGRDWRLNERLWAGFAVRAFVAQFDTSATRWTPIAGTLSVSISYR